MLIPRVHLGCSAPPSPRVTLLFPTRQTTAPMAPWFKDIQELSHTNFDVVKVEHRRMSVEKHDFLLVLFQCDGATNSLIVQRRSSHVMPPPASESPAAAVSTQHSVQDTITTCGKYERLHVTGDHSVLRSLTFTHHPSPSLTLLRLATVGYAVSRRVPDQTEQGHRCYWFANALFDVLREKFDGMEQYAIRYPWQRRRCCPPILHTISLEGVLQTFDREWQNVLDGKARREREVEANLNMRVKAEQAEERARQEQLARERAEVEVDALRQSLMKITKQQVGMDCV